MKSNDLQQLLDNLAICAPGQSVSEASLSYFVPPSGQINWTMAAQEPIGNSEGQGVLVNGKLYVFGGFDKQKACCTPTDRAWVFDPVTNRWSAIASLPPMNGTGHGGVTHSGFTTDGTDIYFAGGYTSNNTGTFQIFGTKEVWKYGVSTNSYARLPDLPVERAAGQLEYLNGDLHYIGGTNKPRTMDVGDHYILNLNNLAAGWKILAALPNPRHHAGSVVLGGEIYFIGGQHGHDAMLVTQPDVHRYNPQSNAWTKLANLPRGRGHISQACFVLNGKIFALGGEISHGSHVSDVTVYDPVVDQWESWTPLPANRASGISKAINGIVYYTSGSWSPTTYKGTIGALVLPTTIRINSGGPEQSVDGTVWEGCTAASCVHVTGGFAFKQSNTITGFSAPLNQTILQSEWTGGQTNGIPAGAVAFKYNIPVQNGNYTVRLHFVELNKNSPGLRVFDVNIEGGAKELINFDIFQQASGMNKAIFKDFPVTVSDEEITIEFIRQIENAKISAIEIVPGSSDPDPKPDEDEIQVTKLYLINPSTSQRVKELNNGDVIASGQSVNIEAITSPEVVGSVRFALNGKSNFRTESAAPYALGGDNNGIFQSINLPAGINVLEAIPYPQNNGKGDPGKSSKITFTVGSNVRMDQAPAKSTSSEELIVQQPYSEFKATRFYPNPVNDELTVGYYGQISKDGIQLQLVSRLGVVYPLDAHTYQIEGNTIKVNIKDLNLSAGVYILKVAYLATGKSEVFRLIKY